MESDGACFVYPAGDDLHYVGCRLRHLLSITALGADIVEYNAGRRRRMVDFLSCLMNPRDDRYVFDLRFLAEPDPELYTRGSISLILLCRISGGTPAEAEEYGVNLLNLLHCYFPECEFERAGIDDIIRHLNPFEVRHLLSITRRAGMEIMDTLRGSRRIGRSMGFTATDATRKVAPEGDAVFHIFPFLHSAASHNGLFKLLLLERSPVAVSCRLQPTSILPEEEAFIEEQITRCERAAQAGLGVTGEDLCALRPTLREQARLYQRYQSRLLFGLKDNAALLTLEVASPEPIPPTLLDAVGNLVTEPAGGTHAGLEDSQERHLSGGYEIVNLSADDGAVEGFGRLDVTPLRHPVVPAGAGRIFTLFDSVEATAAFRLPPATVDIPAGLPVQFWRTQPPPSDLPRTGSLLGVSVHSGTTQYVRIGRDDRRKHIYAVGQTGTGKTTLLKTLILDDIRSGEGVCVIDPHGDLFRELLGMIPEERIGDVVVLDPTDTGFPVGLNMIECCDESQRHFLVQEFTGIIMRLIEDEYGSRGKDYVGPIFFQHMRMNLLLAMSDPDDPGTLLEFHNIYQEPDYWRKWLPLKSGDPLLRKWVRNVLPGMDYLKSGSESVSMGAYVGSKFEGFVFDPALRNIFGQKRSSVDLRKVMDEGKIILVNLAKGELTETNAKFLGMVLLAKIMAAALGRVSIPERERRDFYLYVDEFQSFATESFVTLLSEGRKFGISLILANQFISQIRDARITDAIFGNVGTMVCFRLGTEDAEILEKAFFPTFNRFDLCNLPNWHAYMQTLTMGERRPPFSLQTISVSTPYDDSVAAMARECSRISYGIAKEEVEKMISSGLVRKKAAGSGEGG